MSDNKKFECSAIFLGVFGWLLIVDPNNQSEYTKLQPYFDVFRDRTVILHTNHQREILHSLIFVKFNWQTDIETQIHINCAIYVKKFLCKNGRICPLKLSNVKGMQTFSNSAAISVLMY